MRILRSLIVCGLALIACAAFAIAPVSPPVVAPLVAVLAIGLLSTAIFIASASSLRFRKVLRSDEIQRHFRLFRLLWERGTPGVPGGGYSAKLAIGLRPRFFERERESGKAFLFTILGLRIHYSRSYGGIFT
ncbi:hypothetical protein [Agrobacterium sp. OT33]|uniref:hypothetical protein n=1 Tax=Agrobacterium sp. OT33 TaxID=2815338 RepID=UPI001A8F5B98|nr:hypothetical protein [Agrobacterium sp. OT33]MBO0125203.1 hypothetical protein [Agrobacterium sp. OT33]